jgi:hypothetical protein
MTLAVLSERLGIPVRTLYGYRRSFPNQVPKNFELESWREFIGKIRNYCAERTRPKDRNGNGTEPSAEDQNGEHAEFSAVAERKERILRLRLGNQVRRSKLQLLCASVITLSECELILDHIRKVAAADLLGAPANMCHKLANRDPEYIRQTLDEVLRESLDRLSRPESYL